MEEVQLLGMALVHCPCFTCVEQRAEHYCPVHLQLGLFQTLACSLPKVALALAILTFTSSLMVTF